MVQQSSLKSRLSCLTISIRAISQPLIQGSSPTRIDGSLTYSSYVFSLLLPTSEERLLDMMLFTPTQFLPTLNILCRGLSESLACRKNQRLTIS